MYLSTDAQGGRIAVTGLLLTPLNQKPGHDNPLVADSPGTRGLSDKCAPSRQADLLEANPASPEYSLAEYEQLLLHGVSVVVTDYEGQGTPGLPSYLVGRGRPVQSGFQALPRLVRARAVCPVRGAHRDRPRPRHRPRPPRGVEWLVDRLSGGTAPEGCEEVGLG